MWRLLKSFWKLFVNFQNCSFGYSWSEPTYALFSVSSIFLNVLEPCAVASNVFYRKGDEALD